MSDMISREQRDVLVQQSADPSARTTPDSMHCFARFAARRCWSMTSRTLSAGPFQRTRPNTAMLTNATSPLSSMSKTELARLQMTVNMHLLDRLIEEEQHQPARVPNGSRSSSSEMRPAEPGGTGSKSASSYTDDGSAGDSASKPQARYDAALTVSWLIGVGGSSLLVVYIVNWMT